MMEIKTLSWWNDTDLEMDEYLNPLDEIDEELYWHIACGWMASHYQHGGLIQGGDPIEKISTDSGGIYTYATVNEIGGRFYYLGDLPEFKQ